MTDTAETTELDTTEDMTEASLRSWGLSGMPVTWAWTDWQPVVSTIRAANTGFGDAAAVQTALDAVFPGMGYQAANVCLAHPVTAVFTLAPGDIDPDVDPNAGSYIDIVHVDLVDDEDLDLPNEQVTWDFGDGTEVAHDIYGWEHGYTTPGTYRIRCTIPVAGVLYGTDQLHVVDGPVAEPVVAPEYAARPETVFTSATDDLPNDSNLQQTEAPDAAEGPYDPGEHTVAEVLEYAEAHPDEAEAIFTAEEAGKARSTILDKL